MCWLLHSMVSLFHFSHLPELLKTMDLSQLKPFDPGHPEKFTLLLDKLFRFS